MSAAPPWVTKWGRLTPDERTEIERLAERHWPTTRIAERLGRHPSTVGFYRATHGLGPAAGARKGNCRRGGLEVRGFTAEEDAFIQALRCHGYSTGKIAAFDAERFGYARSASTISVRLRMLASWETAADAEGNGLPQFRGD